MGQVLQVQLDLTDVKDVWTKSYLGVGVRDNVITSE